MFNQNIRWLLVTLLCSFTLQAMDPGKEPAPEQDDPCAICLGTKANKRVSAVFGCPHTFHDECIDLWIKQNGIESCCPICRAKLGQKRQLDTPEPASAPARPASYRQTPASDALPPVQPQVPHAVGHSRVVRMDQEDLLERFGHSLFGDISGIHVSGSVSIMADDGGGGVIYVSGPVRRDAPAQFAESRWSDQHAAASAGMAGPSRAPANPNARDDEKHQALVTAARRGDVATTIALLQHRADPNTRDQNGSSALAIAVRKGDVAITNVLLQYHADPNARDQNGNSALAIAVRNGDVATTNVLLQHYADPDARDQNGNQALAIAVRNGDVAITNVLLQHHADPNARDQNGNTAMEIALRTGNAAIINLLLSSINR